MCCIIVSDNIFWLFTSSRFSTGKMSQLHPFLLTLRIKSIYWFIFMVIEDFSRNRCWLGAYWKVLTENYINHNYILKSVILLSNLCDTHRLLFCYVFDYYYTNYCYISILQEFIVSSQLDYSDVHFHAIWISSQSV